MYVDVLNCGKLHLELARDPEAMVAGFMDGTSEVPKEVKPLVEAYKACAKSIFKCGKYPRHIQLTMDAIYDSLVALAEKGAI